MRQLKINKSITNRESASMDKYFQEISNEDLITAEDEITLAQRIHKGDQIAMEKLIKANLRFVVSVAKQYPNKNLSLSDLISEGNLGLVKAAKRFDETRGFKFISYAVWWIRQSILQALADQSHIVRLPQNIATLSNTINRVMSELEQSNERKPSAEELSEELGISAKKISDTLRASGRPLSVDAPFVDDGGITLLDTLEDMNSPHADNTLISESLNEEINRVLSVLTEREADIIRMFFGIGIGQAMTLKQIGVHIKLSLERVRQIKERAMQKLRRTAKSGLLKSYLG